MLKLAIQKKGRLQEDSLNLLRECGLDFETNLKELLKVRVRNFPLEIFFLRNSDIPEYVSDGVVDAGIIGENTAIECQVNLHKVKKLGFGKCRLSLAVPKETAYQDVSFFNHKTIATSYPHTLKTFLNEHGFQTKIHEINGSVELSTHMGLADGICDLVSTGGTLMRNGLKEVFTIFQSEVALFTHTNLKPDQEQILQQLNFRIESVLQAKKNKYILMNVPNDKLDEVIRVLPGIKSPTILPLAQSGWSSIHTVIQKDNFWTLIHQLKQHGAEGILVIPIEQMIF